MELVIHVFHIEFLFKYIYPAFKMKATMVKPSIGKGKISLNSPFTADLNCIDVVYTWHELNRIFGWYSSKFQKVAEEVARLHDEFYTNKTLQEMAKVSTLQKLGSKYYSDSDLVDTLPKDLEFNT